MVHKITWKTVAHCQLVSSLALGGRKRELLLTMSKVRVHDCASFKREKNEGFLTTARHRLTDGGGAEIGREGQRSHSVAQSLYCCFD